MSRNENPNKHPRNLKNTLKFMGVAIVLILIVDYFFMGTERPYYQTIRDNFEARQKVEDQMLQEKIEPLLPPKVVYPEDGTEYFEAEPALSEETAPEELMPEPVEEEAPKELIKEQESEPKAEEQSKIDLTPIKPKLNGPKAKIAIVIDDVGVNVKQSRVALTLPPAVTMAFLPYANNVREMAANAKARGHELLIHAPMEAVSSDVPLGSMALLERMDFAEFDAEFKKIANSFDGYVGVNNHMGSRLTQNSKSMGYLMDQLKARGLYFFDSRTIGSSVAASTAAAYGVPNATRDVFLDHEDTAEFVRTALRKVEKTARKNGYAIAIGHPKQNTMRGLKAWIPTLEKKGFELVPLSALINKPKERTIVVEKQTPEFTLEGFDLELSGQSFNDMMPAAGEQANKGIPAGVDPIQDRAYE